MKQISRVRFLGSSCIVLACLLIGACGGEQKPMDNRAPFALGWTVTESAHFRLYDPPDSPRIGYAKTFSDQCEALYDQFSRLMGVQVPDKIEIYRFITNRSCEKASGHATGYIDGLRIYTRIGASIGGAIAEAACTYIDPEAESFPMIRHGLRKAFDNQSTNIHLDAYALEGAGRWLTLEQLLSGENIEDREAYDLATASFVGYLIQRHGVAKFRALWRSVLELGPSLEKIYGGTIEQLGEDWLTHVQHESKKT